ncbi:hypothetical protein LCGC14_0340850 [marine sediment metagenome]|uniref:Uncharacterized protein n=1 Tax=marine sediment metagenome TaxID=412755 RepID=A0A0F9WL80_9ZZZZ
MRRYILVLPVIVLFMMGLSLYLLRTVDIDTPDGVIEIVNPEGIVDKGFLARSYHMIYQLVPTEKTQSDVVYRIVVNNGSVRQEDKVYWTQLGLNIGKAKLIKHNVSRDEFTALGLRPQYEVEITEVKSERNKDFLMYPVLYIGVMSLVAMCGVSLLGKPRIKERINYIRPFRNKEVELEQETVSDEEQLQRCMRCLKFKMINGKLVCGAEECNYK